MMSSIPSLRLTLIILVVLLTVIVLRVPSVQAQSDDCHLRYGDAAVYEVHGSGVITCVFDGQAGDYILPECNGCILGQVAISDPSGVPVYVQEPLSVTGQYKARLVFNAQGDTSCAGNTYPNETECYIYSNGADCEQVDGGFSEQWCAVSDAQQSTGSGNIVFTIDRAASSPQGSFVYAATYGEQTMFTNESFEVDRHGQDGIDSVLTSGGNSAEPSISPDEKHITYVQFRNAATDSVGDIYVMDADGTNARSLIADGHSGRPVWSPDGHRILFMSDKSGNYDLYVVDVDGAHLSNLTHDAASDRMPRWSADGLSIYFQSDRSGTTEIYVMNADGSNVRQLTKSSGADSNFYPIPSPDGSEIAFASNRDQHGVDASGAASFEIYVMASDGSNQRPLTDNQYDDFPLTWSPDGNQLVFVSGPWRLMMMRADGSDLTRVVLPASVHAEIGASWVNANISVQISATVTPASTPTLKPTSTSTPTMVAQTEQPTAQALIDQARAAEKAGDIEAAYTLVSQAIALDAHDAQAYGLRAGLVITYSVRDLDSAKDDLDIALQIDPNDATILALFAQYYDVLGDGASALRYANQALQLNPTLDTAYYARADANLFLNHKDEAIKDYLVAAKTLTDHYDIFLNLGLAYTRVNNNLAAVADFNRAVSIDPSRYEAYYYRGLVEASLKQFDKVLQDAAAVYRANSTLQGINRLAFVALSTGLMTTDDLGAGWQSTGQTLLPQQITAMLPRQVSGFLPCSSANIDTLFYSDAFAASSADSAFAEQVIYYTDEETARSGYAQLARGLSICGDYTTDNGIEVLSSVDAGFQSFGAESLSVVIQDPRVPATFYGVATLVRQGNSIMMVRYQEAIGSASLIDIRKNAAAQTESAVNKFAGVLPSAVVGTAPEPTPTPTPTFTPLPSATPAASNTPTYTPTFTPSETFTATWTATITPTSTATPSPTLTVTPSITPTATITLSPTVTLTPTEIPTATDTPIPPKLKIGDQGQALSPDGLTVYDATNTKGDALSVVSQGDTVSLIQGPRKVGKDIWWQVLTTDGTYGWAQERADTELLMSYGDPVLQCPKSAPSQLIVGGQGIVLPGDPNLINSRPSRRSEDSNSLSTGRISGGGVFSVLGGPVCNMGITWWLVKYRGTTGWTGEMEFDDYWVEPA